MSVTSALLEASECTSCAVTQDKSIYWTPTLYFVHNNGSSELVDQVGGTLVYVPWMGPFTFDRAF